MPPRDDEPRAPRRAIKWYKKLSTRKGRLERGVFLVEGVRAVRHIAQYQPEAIEEVLYLGLPPLDLQHVPASRIQPRQLAAITNTKSPQDILAVVRFAPEVYTDQLPDPIGSHVLLLEEVQDPGNVGALIRTAAAFGFAGVMLSDKCADPLSPKAVQATAGTVLSLWLRRTARYLDLLQVLRQNGYRCVATDPRGVAGLASLASYKRLVLALGNEATGLSAALRQMADDRIKIPMRGAVESLNVAASGAICMYVCAVQTLSGDKES
jgi:TrmH family RNA methyltransferase